MVVLEGVESFDNVEKEEHLARLEHAWRDLPPHHATSIGAGRTKDLKVLGDQA